jgi:hypothetical protein
MTAADKTDDGDLVVQDHCIDLPGETVQCWIGGGTDKLKVILRKHRDVIFDVHLGNGKIYTVETTESDFYNVRDKRLIFAAQHGKVTFKDGERIHLWVSRGFRGALILKCENHVISAVEPNEWDTHQHGGLPTHKPAPIIVAIGNLAKPTGSPAASQESTVQHEEQSVHIHEVSKRGAPPDVLKFFEDGGESLELDSQNIITRNWITAQLFGTAGYVSDNRTWIRELINHKFYLQRVLHKSGPKIYIVFKGNNKLRTMMSASRYGLQNSKIMRITGGAGGVKQAWDATKGAAKDSIKVFAKEEGQMVVKGGGIAIVLTIGMDVAEWHKDYSEIGPDGKPKKDFYDLLAKVGTDLAKAGLVAVLTTATVAAGFTVLAAVGVTVAAPILLVVAGTIAVSIFWTYMVERADKAVARASGGRDTSNWLADTFRGIAQYLAHATKDPRYAGYQFIPIVP